MFRKRFWISSLAALFVSVAGAAHAADYPLPPAPAQPCCDNWYLRGYVGLGINDYSLEYKQNPANSSDFAFDHTSIADTPFLGFGVGYVWNNWLRLEATAEYRSKTRVYAYGHYTFGGGTFLDTYEGNLNSWLFLANAFVDLGTWECFTPFIGAGVGGAYLTLSDFSDINPSLAGFGVGRNPSEWNFAWALYAGVSYAVSKNFNIDLTYRYLNYGNITDTVDCAGGCNPDSFKFKDLYSNDIMLGLRWTCCDVPPPPPPPLRSRG